MMEVPIPKSSIHMLQKRIDALAHTLYMDPDCRLYAKRLRREGGQILTFLKYDYMSYHNNTSDLDHLE